ncbi:unnamed protein product [Camellia sinensis]
MRRREIGWAVQHNDKYKVHPVYNSRGSMKPLPPDDLPHLVFGQSVESFFKFLESESLLLLVDREDRHDEDGGVEMGL